jgi:hypothetical protein
MSVHPIHPSPRAVTDGATVTITDLTSSLPELVTSVVRYKERTGADDVGDHVESLLDLGAKAAAVGSASIDVDEIKRSLDDFTNGVSDTAKASVTDIRTAVAAATDKETGAIAKTLESALGNLSIAISSMVAGEDAPLRTSIEKSVRSVTDKALGEVQRALAAQSETVKTALSPDNPTGPLASLKHELLKSGHESRAEIVSALNEVKVLVETARVAKQVMEKTAIKGLAYEDAALLPLTAIALAAGDSLEPTGRAPGAMARCKNGDAVVTLSQVVTRQHDVKLAVEVKDKTLTCDGWKAELKAAQKNRGAVAALGISRSIDHVPGDKRVLILDPLNIVVVFDPEHDNEDLLAATYHLLRAQAACTALDGVDDGLDIVGLRRHLAAAFDVLVEFDKIERATGNARKNLDDISKTALKLSTTLDSQLRGALTLLDSAAQSDAVA